MATGMTGMLAGLGSGVIGSAIVELQVADAEYKAKMAAAQAQGETATTSLGSSFSRMKVLGAAAFAAVGYAAVRFGATAIEAASAHEEAMNAVNVTFEDSADAVVAFSEVSARAFGISSTAALKTAVDFGSMLQTAGLMQEQAAQMSVSLTQLGADLASLRDIDPAVALEKLRSGLAGEAEPLRVLGVFLSEARVKAEAYESGIAKLGSELTEGQKVQARYNLILKDTKTAHGDVANTADSLANQQRSLNAQFEDFLVLVGGPLQTALARILEGINEYARVAPNALGTIENAFLNLVNVFITIANAFNTYFVNPIIAGLNRVVDAVDIAAGPLVNFGEIPDFEMVEMLDEVQHSIKQTGAAAEENFSQIKGDFSQAGKSVHRFANMSGDSLKEWRSTVKDTMHSAIFDIQNMEKDFDFTAKQFVKGQKAMLERARLLSRAQREIANEKWINEDYLAFIEESGPGAIVAFEQLNDQKQRQMQGQWLETVKKTDKAKGSVDDVSRALKNVDGFQANAGVNIHYSVSGEDIGNLPGFEPDNAQARS